MEMIKIIQHNVLSLTFNRKNELYNSFAKHNPDVILLNSTCALNTDTDKIKWFTYKVYQRNYANENHAGVAICIKYDIQYKIIDNFEQDTLAIEIETNRGPVIIATTYTPPRRRYLVHEDYLKLINNNKPVYLLGDINAHHPLFNYNYTDVRGNYISRIINNGQLNYLGPDFPTLTDGRGRPDAILGNRHAAMNWHIAEGDITTSDHIPIIFTIATKPIAVITPPRFNYKKANWETFKTIVVDNLNTLNSDDPRESSPDNINQDIIHSQIDKWTTAISQARERSVPKSTMKLIAHNENSDLINLLTIQYKRLKEKINRQGATNEERLLIRNIQTSLKEEGVRVHNDTWTRLLGNIETSYQDAAKFWGQVKKLMGGKEPHPAYLLRPDNTKAFEIEDQLELFTETWANTFKISDEDNELFDEDHEVMVNEYIEQNWGRTQPYEFADLSRLDNNNPLTREITNEDIKLVIKQFKNKAPGESGINKTLLSQLPDELITDFRINLNLTLSMGLYPKNFKIGLINLAPKPGKSPHNPINYRPITLLEVQGKLFERILNNRFMEYLESNNILPKNQFGFRKGMGTQSALSIIYETINMNQINRNQANIVTRDVSKAFDHVWFNGLKYKVLHLEVADIFEKTLCNFLDNRTAKIKYQNKIGLPINIQSGVPQGSILAPTLYIFYIHDVPQPEANCLDVGFADDITQIVIHNHPSKRFLALKTERAINRINEYEALWKIKTNKDKFKITSISKAKPHEVKVDDEIIPFSPNTKVLGLTISRTGIRTHTKNRLRTAKIQRAKLKRFKNLKSDLQVRLYKTLIRPILEYPIVPVCVSSKSSIKTFQQFQNVSLRNATKNNQEDRHLTLEELHIKYRIEPINIRFHRLANRVWDKLSLTAPDLVAESREMTLQHPNQQHYWWKRVDPYVNSDEPEPLFL